MVKILASTTPDDSSKLSIQGGAGTSKPVSSIFGKSPPSSQENDATPVSKMSSIRDSFRRIETIQMDSKSSSRSNEFGRPRFGNGIKSSMSQNSKSSESHNPSILQNFNNESSDPETSNAVTSSKSFEEKRYDRKVVHLEKKKEMFQQSISDSISPSGTNTFSTNASISSAKVNSKTNKKSNVVDIAELKRQTELKLKSQQIELQELLERQKQQKQSDPQQNDSQTKRTSLSPSTPTPIIVREVTIPYEGMNLRELASKLSIKMPSLKTKIEDLGESVGDGESSLIDADVIELVALELGFNAKRVAPSKKTVQQQQELNPSIAHDTSDCELLPRSPVVCVMGHVDHGKTTLLDALRRFGRENNALKHASPDNLTAIAGSEAGGITQKLSAFSVSISAGSNTDDNARKDVLFLDTPGHAAFSAMRSYGAMATDIVVLVVAIDDGVRPQTIEAAKIALESGSKIIIAVNKADKVPVEDREKALTRVLTQLLDVGLVAEQFGGDVQAVLVAGKTGDGLSQLVESLLLQAEVMDLKAANTGQAEGVVLDAHVEKGRGVVAEVLVKWGQISIGDCVVIGSSYGKVKAMQDSYGRSVQVALPSQAVRLLGLRHMPPPSSSGGSFLGGSQGQSQELITVAGEARARQIADRRNRVDLLRRTVEQEQQQKLRQDALLALQEEQQRVLDASSTVSTSKTKAPPISAAMLPAVAAVPQLNVVLKADGVGPLEALRQLVLSVTSRTSDVLVRILSAAVGDVNPSDIERVSTTANPGSSKVLAVPLVLAFNVGLADSSTRATANELDVRVVRDNVIYRLEDELIATMEAHMPKEKISHLEGSAKVLKVFRLNDKKSTVVAGMSVVSGHMKNSGGHHVFRVLRSSKGSSEATVLLDDFNGHSDLKRFKDTVHEVESGNECGLSLEEFSDFQEGDEVQCVRVEWKAKSLQIATSRDDKWTQSATARVSKGATSPQPTAKSKLAKL